MISTLYLDLATTTGWCTGTPDRYVSAVETFAKEDNNITRLIKFRNFLLTAGDFKRVVAESPFIMNRGNAGPILYGLHTTLQLFCYDNRNIELVYIPPKTLKKFITGNGNANKEKMMEALYKKYKIAVFNDNQADAIALMLYDHKN